MLLGPLVGRNKVEAWEELEILRKIGDHPVAEEHEELGSFLVHRQPSRSTVVVYYLQKESCLEFKT